MRGRPAAALRGAALAWLVLAAACGPLVVEREGHHVFNPSWVWALDYRRDEWQKPEEVLSALALPEDAVVADIGAGGGYFTERLSRLLVSGHVFATDVQPEMIEKLNHRVRERGLTNVTVVRAAFDDPGLPETCCDLVFFSSVYKEIEDRVAYMRRVRPLLRPGGRVAILEFRPGAPGTGPPEAMRLAPERIVAELGEAGFVLLESHDFIPHQSFLVFAVAADRDSPGPQSG